jgi:pilus assembly protein Flp/PilA
MNRIGKLLRRLARRVDGAVFVEYLLLLTLVGIGVIAGLAAVRGAMLSELQDLTDAIKAISS